MLLDKGFHLLETFHGLLTFAMSSQHLQPAPQGFFVRRLSQDHGPVLFSCLPQLALRLIPLCQPLARLPEHVFSPLAECIAPRPLFSLYQFSSLQQAEGLLQQRKGQGRLRPPILRFFQECSRRIEVRPDQGLPGHFIGRGPQFHQGFANHAAYQRDGIIDIRLRGALRPDIIDQLLSRESPSGLHQQALESTSSWFALSPGVFGNQFPGSRGVFFPDF
ncbi:MAG TPA: hypothetical protein VFV38_43095 [Ktedonobacteraceae bacterium]|nr:hypothetical protein [Ktedonobacteraceae bacterium]